MDNQPQPTKPTNKALWIVLIIVVLAIAGYGIYTLISNKDNENTNNTNSTVNQNTNVVANANTVLNTNTAVNLNTNIDTSGWKNFSNNKYGFSVKMPQSWQVTQSSVNRDTFNYESFGINPGKDTHAGYQVNVYNSVKDLADGNSYSTLAEWIAAQATGPYTYPSTDFLGQGTYEGLWPSADETYSFYIEHGGRVYNIDMNWISPENRATDPTTKRAVFNLEEEAFLKSFKLL